MESKPQLAQINLVVSDLAQSIAFYRMLGLEMSDPTGLHASMTFPNGLRFDLDEHEFAQQWSSSTPSLAPGSAVLNLEVPQRSDVDDLWQRAVHAGQHSYQKPYDAFWGSRFAIVADPDGYQIGIMSPSEHEHRFWPPSQAPAA